MNGANCGSRIRIRITTYGIWFHITAIVWTAKNSLRWFLVFFCNEFIFRDLCKQLELTLQHGAKDRDTSLGLAVIR